MRSTRTARRIALIAAAASLAGAAGAATSVFAGAGGLGGAGSGELASSLEAWGENAYGQIGNGVRTESVYRSPVSVEGVTCASSAAVSAEDSYAVLGDGHVAAWGADSAEGGLGDAHAYPEYSYKPVEVPGISTATQLAADSQDAFVRLEDGTIAGWGTNLDGQYGLGSATAGGDAPVADIGGLTEGVSAVATGNGAVLALLSSGEVQSWGYNEDGQLGHDAKPAAEPTPARVKDAAGTGSLENVKAIAVGSTFALALTDSGEVLAWGGDSFTGLGAGALKAESLLPVNVEDAEGNGDPLTHVVAIAAGADFALALLENKTVVAWGADQLGQLGNGETHGSPPALHPVAVAGLSDVEEIAATQEDGYARLANATVWAWGNNTQGEVGDGSGSTPIDAPAQVSGLGEGTSSLARGEDAEHEIALGAVSADCGAGTGSSGETNTEPTSSNPGSTVSSNPTSSTPTQTSTVGNVPGGASTATADQLALRCTARKLALTDVVERAGRVLLDGAAASSLAGHRVKILFDDHQQVASATIAANGLFSASAPLPPAKLRDGNSARYLAESGDLRSLDLKLTRRLILDPPTGSAGKVTLTGEVQPPLAKPIAAIVVQQELSCASTRTVARITPSAGGRFEVTIAAPASSQAALYRLSTKVRESTSSRKLFATDSLPEAISLAP